MYTEGLFDNKTFYKTDVKYGGSNWLGGKRS